LRLIRGRFCHSAREQRISGKTVAENFFVSGDAIEVIPASGQGFYKNMGIRRGFSRLGAFSAS